MAISRVLAEYISKYIYMKWWNENNTIYRFRCRRQGPASPAKNPQRALPVLVRYSWPHEVGAGFGVGTCFSDRKVYVRQTTKRYKEHQKTSCSGVSTGRGQGVVLEGNSLPLRSTKWDGNSSELISSTEGESSLVDSVSSFPLLLLLLLDPW